MRRYRCSVAPFGSCSRPRFGVGSRVAMWGTPKDGGITGVGDQHQPPRFERGKEWWPLPLLALPTQLLPSLSWLLLWPSVQKLFAISLPHFWGGCTQSWDYHPCTWSRGDSEEPIASKAGLNHPDVEIPLGFAMRFSAVPCRDIQTSFGTRNSSCN